MNKKKNKPTHVFAIKRDGKPYRYMARVTKQFVQTYLGCFKTQKEAAEAVKMYFQSNKKREKN